MNAAYTLSHARRSDLPEMQVLVRNTIRNQTREHYTPEQIEVWIASTKNTERWIEAIDRDHYLICRNHREIVGLASLRDHDHIDFLYVHHARQRKGIASILYKALEQEAIRRRADRLSSNVSFTARPFFERQGFEVVRRNNNILDGVEIINFHMIKTLIATSGRDDPNFG